MDTKGLAPIVLIILLILVIVVIAAVVMLGGGPSDGGVTPPGPSPPTDGGVAPPEPAAPTDEETPPESTATTGCAEFGGTTWVQELANDIQRCAGYKTAVKMLEGNPTAEEKEAGEVVMRLCNYRHEISKAIVNNDDEGLDSLFEDAVETGSYRNIYGYSPYEAFAAFNENPDVCDKIIIQEDRDRFDEEGLQEYLLTNQDVRTCKAIALRDPSPCETIRYGNTEWQKNRCRIRAIRDASSCEDDVCISTICRWE